MGSFLYVLFWIEIYDVRRSIRFSTFLFMVKMVEGDGQPAATVSPTLKKVSATHCSGSSFQYRSKSIGYVTFWTRRIRIPYYLYGSGSGSFHLPLTMLSGTEINTFKLFRKTYFNPLRQWLIFTLFWLQVVQIPGSGSAHKWHWCHGNILNHAINFIICSHFNKERQSHQVPKAESLSMPDRARKRFQFNYTERQAGT